ncbi:MAG: hypothetical protein J3T61_12070 [Candidatus Brocadiales bacterium]|nr:hypothetical protein [Candidatus Bathyanammoxibius sp.]
MAKKWEFDFGGVFDTPIHDTLPQPGGYSDIMPGLAWAWARWGGRSG